MLYTQKIILGFLVLQKKKKKKLAHRANTQIWNKSPQPFHRKMTFNPYLLAFYSTLNISKWSERKLRYQVDILYAWLALQKRIRRKTIHIVIWEQGNEMVTFQFIHPNILTLESSWLVVG